MQLQQKLRKKVIDNQMKKKQKEEPKRMIYVLKNNTPDTTYGGNQVIAQDSKEKLEQYKQQLINNGYEDVFTIEEQEHRGWSSVIRYSGYNLVEHDGLFYTQKNVESAQRRVNERFYHLKQMAENLSELKLSVPDGYASSYDDVINSIEIIMIDLSKEKLEIKMI